MLDQHFRSSTAPPGDVFGPLEGGERMMWRGRAGVAEYAFDQAASLPRWTLPESTEVLVTDRRVVYAYATEEQDFEITSGELRWLWPQHLRLQPGARSTDRGAAASQIQLVCGSADGGFPALVFAGGDLRTVGDADRLANVLRLAIARFRVDHAEKLGLSTAQTRMLSRLLIGPEFSNYQGGDGQTVSLAGALLVTRSTRAEIAPPFAEPELRTDGEHHAEIDHSAEGGTRVMIVRPGLEADAQRAWEAAQAEEATHQARPDLASRAATLAARVASMVSETSGPAQASPAQTSPAQTSPAQTSPAPDERPPPSGADPQSLGERLSASGPAASGPAAEESFLLDEMRREDPDPDRFDVPTTNLAERAERVRRSAARFAGNSARARAARRPDRETGISTRGNRNG
jgi:hypothetical protein